MSNVNKVALITGANKGIGFEIARQLGQQGITVLIGARDLQRGEEATAKLRSEDINAYTLQLDVTDQSSIEQAASQIDSQFGKLDILVNNAGITSPKARVQPSQLDIEVLRTIYETNVFGVFATIKAMLPLLRRSDAGRIVNLSSPAGSLSNMGNPASGMPEYMQVLFAYGSSKTLVNSITVYFANELRNTSIKVNAVSPGYVATDLNNHSGNLTTQQGAQVPVAYATLPEDGPTGGFFDANGLLPW